MLQVEHLEATGEAKENTEVEDKDQEDEAETEAASSPRLEMVKVSHSKRS